MTGGVLLILMHPDSFLLLLMEMGVRGPGEISQTDFWLLFLLECSVIHGEIFQSKSRGRMTTTTPNGQRQHNLKQFWGIILGSNHCWPVLLCGSVQVLVFVDSGQKYLPHPSNLGFHWWKCRIIVCGSPNTTTSAAQHKQWWSPTLHECWKSRPTLQMIMSKQTESIQFF